MFMLRNISTSCLIWTANRQLHHLLQRTSCKITLATEQPHRCCQDDSKQKTKSKKSRSKVNEERKSTKATGPAVNLLEKDLHDLLCQRQKEIPVEERSSLQRRMDLLRSLGCTMDQIQDNVEILNLSEQTILRRATMLMELGRTPVTVDLLLVSKHVTTEELKKYLQWSDQVDEALCLVLQCSPKQLMQLKKNHACLNRFRCITAADILEKAETLKSFGVTSQQIRDFPGILNIRVENIKERMGLLKRLREEGQLDFDRYPLNTVSERTRSFDTRVQRALDGRAEIDGSAITMQTIAQHLGMKAKDIEDASINFFKMNPSRALKKIGYLLGQGISNQDILSHIYMMRYRYSSIVWATEQSRSIVGGATPSIYVILSFLRSGRLPKKSFVWSRQRTYVASLLGVQASDLPSADARPLYSSDRLQIKRNFDFLTSEGFSHKDILSCVILLAHDPDALKEYYSGLWDRPEVAGLVENEVREDKTKVLALLQYLIEKDMNFTSSVFLADVEYETGPAAISNDGSPNLEDSVDNDDDEPSLRLKNLE